MIRVLHVDDDEEFAELVSRFLERENGDFDVVTVSDPSAALTRLEDGDIDCIVSDYDMPETSGIELLEAVREGYASIPFILFTAQGSKSVASTAISAGVTDYVQKSTGSDQYTLLANRIENAVDQYRSQQRLDRFKKPLEELPVGVIVLDEEAKIEWINQAALTAIDATEGELLGTPFMNLIESGLVEEGIVEKYLDAVRTLLSSETDADVVDFEFEIDPLHKPGIREYEGYIALRRLVDGEYRGTVTAFTHVTDRKTREHELGQYEAAVETVPDGVFLLDENGVMTRVNQAWADIVGYDPAELNGQPFEKLVEDGIIDRRVVETYLDLLPELLASDSDRKRAKFLTRVVPPSDDRVHVYEVHVGLLPYVDEFRGTASVVRDVTEKVDRQRELERENERLDEFASIVSHDLRNPLNVVRAGIDMAERSGDPEYFEECRDAIERMDRLINDLLDRARQGEDLDTVETVELSEVVETCWETIETNRTTLRTETDITIEADERRLEQLIENLLSNAIEHGGDTITITVGDLEDADGFFVADDGSGVPDEVGEKVFERGFSTNGGTGVGLKIVEGVAEAHDWSVELTEGDGGGARFEFTIGGATKSDTPMRRAT